MKNLIALVCMKGYARHTECNLVFHSYLKETKKKSNNQFLNIFTTQMSLKVYCYGAFPHFCMYGLSVYGLLEKVQKHFQFPIWQSLQREKNALLKIVFRA